MFYPQTNVLIGILSCSTILIKVQFSPTFTTVLRQLRSISSPLPPLTPSHNFPPLFLFSVFFLSFFQCVFLFYLFSFIFFFVISLSSFVAFVPIVSVWIAFRFLVTHLTRMWLHLVSCIVYFYILRWRLSICFLNLALKFCDIHILQWNIQNWQVEAHSTAG